jgi:REP element-mobilizing transposase RayT
MTRIARVFVPGVAHHVTRRGDNHQDVFFTDDDRNLYFSLLKQESSRHGVRVLGVIPRKVRIVVPRRDGMRYGGAWR